MMNFVAGRHHSKCLSSPNSKPFVFTPVVISAFEVCVSKIDVVTFLGKMPFNEKISIFKVKYRNTYELNFHHILIYIIYIYVNL